MEESYHKPSDGLVASNGRRGVVGVLIESDHYLVIRRSQWVRAPRMLCFPGGHLESGETLEAAMGREMMEELGLEVRVECHLWSSRTAWGTDLEWMLLGRIPSRDPVANAAEVEQVLWMTREDLLQRADVLGSVRDFFQALDEGRIRL